MFNNINAAAAFQMIKLEELDAFAKEFMSKRLESSTQEMQDTLKRKVDKIRKEYMAVCDRLFRKCITQQEKGKKEDIRYIYFCYLKSAMLTRKHEIQLNAYSKDGYADATETMELWYPSFITDIYEKDMEALDTAAKKKVIHYGYSQYMELREKCFPIYLTFVGKYIVAEIKNVIALDSYTKMQKNSEIQMIYGGYMDYGIQVYPPMEFMSAE